VSRAVWGHHTTDNADEARDRIVTAAETAIRRWGLARTRIDDIADEARCGRSTIYRYFGNRENVIIQVLLRRGRLFGDTLLRHVHDRSDTPDKIVEGVVFALKLIRDDELLWSIFNTEALPSAARLAEASEPLFQLATAVWVELLRADPALERLLRREVGPERAAEWILRIMLSYLAVPLGTQHDGRALRRDLRLLLLPALVDPNPSQEPPDALES
jgi:AcrR family transcriptional regulator